MQAWLVFGAVAAAGVLAVWLAGERGPYVHPSTRAWFRGPLREFPSRLHGYVYGRWSNQYIGIAVWRMRAKRSPRRFQAVWADHYHGKVLPHPLARQVLTLNQDVELRNLERAVPYPMPRDLVIRSPGAIALYNCPCRLARTNPCVPLDVCMVIGEPFASFVLGHNPRSSRHVAQAEALEVLEAEHGRGHVHTAYFKDAMEGRFYAICNCCKCCCGGIQSMVKLGHPMVASSGYIAEMDSERRKGCGLCMEVCPFEAVMLANGAPVVDDGKCMGCGVCKVRCRFGAARLVPDPRKPQPMDLQHLLALGPHG